MSAAESLPEQKALFDAIRLAQVFGITAADLPD